MIFEQKSLEEKKQEMAEAWPWKVSTLCRR